MTKKITKNLPAPAIEIDASTMAGTWNVAFYADSKGFTTWLTVGPGLPKPVKTHSVHEPLTWRVAAEVLADMDEDGLQGDWGNQVVVRGVDGWRAEILKMAASTSENPYYDRLVLLLERGDSEIEVVAQKYGTLLSEDAEQYILRIWGEDPYDQVSMPTKSVEVPILVAITEKPPPASMDECINLLTRWSEAKEKPYANRTNFVAWQDGRSWFIWLFRAAPSDLLFAYEKVSPENAKEIVSWLRNGLTRSKEEIIDLRASRNQAAQIGIGLATTFIDLTTKQLSAYDRLQGDLN